MQASSPFDQFELICVIVNFGMGSRVLSVAKENGVLGGTILLGKGTVENRLLRILELSETRKEIVLMVTSRSLAPTVLDELDKVFHFRKPNHGIAFTTNVLAFLGRGSYEYVDDTQSGGAVESMYRAVFVIVDHGRGEEVMDAAREAGARGGTIIHARGSGIHEHAKLLNMEIEPEKEIVLIIAAEDITREVVMSIRDSLEIDKPGNGIIFVQEVNEAYGIR